MNHENLMTTLKNKFPFKNYIHENSSGDIYKTIFYVSNKYLKTKSRVLDFGSGPCDKTALIALLGHDCTAFDDLQDEWHKASNNSEKILEFSAEMGINYIDSSTNDMDFYESSFDMVILTDVIEHLHNSPRVLLLTLLDALKDDGALLITVPNAGNIRKRLDLLRGRTNMPPFSGYYWYPDPWRGHIREYVYDDLKKLAHFLDLELIELRGADHMLQKVPSWMLPIYKLITTIFPRWKDSWLFVAKKKKGWNPVRESQTNNGHVVHD